MFDLHSHTTWSDGELCPAELVQRAIARGYKGIAITDHGDFSNMPVIIPRLYDFCERLREIYKITVAPGIEITHMPPETMQDCVDMARELGAAVVVVHGETITEPVPKGTNRAAILAKCDVLAHPGLLTLDEAKLAARNNVLLEITARYSHNFGNGRVLAMARQARAKCVIDSDAHAPGDLLTKEFREKVALGAGMTKAEIDAAEKYARKLLDENWVKQGSSVPFQF